MDWWPGKTCVFSGKNFICNNHIRVHLLWSMDKSQRIGIIEQILLHKYTLDCLNWPKKEKSSYWRVPKYLIRFYELITVEVSSKGQLILKANCQAVDSPKKWTNGIWLYYVTTLQVKKANLFVRFLGESTAWQFAFEINWPLGT